MMGYFTETEEYEKCAKIRDIIKTNKQKKKRFLLKESIRFLINLSEEQKNKLL